MAGRHHLGLERLRDPREDPEVHIEGFEGDALHDRDRRTQPAGERAGDRRYPREQARRPLVFRRALAQLFQVLGVVEPRLAQVDARLVHVLVGDLGTLHLVGRILDRLAEGVAVLGRGLALLAALAAEDVGRRARHRAHAALALSLLALLERLLECGHKADEEQGFTLERGPLHRAVNRRLVGGVKGHVVLRGTLVAVRVVGMDVAEMNELRRVRRVPRIAAVGLRGLAAPVFGQPDRCTFEEAEGGRRRSVGLLGARKGPAHTV